MEEPAHLAVGPASPIMVPMVTVMVIIINRIHNLLQLLVVHLLTVVHPALSIAVLVERWERQEVVVIRAAL
jgi:hypothetical protein